MLQSPTKARVEGCVLQIICIGESWTKVAER